MTIASYSLVVAMARTKRYTLSGQLCLAPQKRREFPQPLSDLEFSLDDFEGDARGIRAVGVRDVGRAQGFHK